MKLNLTVTLPPHCRIGVSSSHERFGDSLTLIGLSQVGGQRDSQGTPFLKIYFRYLKSICRCCSVTKRTAIKKPGTKIAVNVVALLLFFLTQCAQDISSGHSANQMPSSFSTFPHLYLLEQFSSLLIQHFSLGKQQCSNKFYTK